MPLHPAPTIDNHLALITQRLTHALAPRQAELTIAFHAEAAITAQFAVDSFQSVFNARFGPQLDSNVVIEKPLVNLGDGTNVPHQAVGAGAAGAGSNAVVSPPPQVSYLAAKHTALGGRKNRGRTFFPWMSSINEIAESGQLSPAFIAGFQPRLNGALVDWTALSMVMVIANKTLATDPITGKRYVTAITMGPEVTTWLAESLVGTQRRRLRG